MAASSGVWGIEIGQTALKALHCVVKDGEIVADAFDYIEYPKILSQPEADPEGMVAEALQQLLDRNEGVLDKVCISVPGQSGLAKFFKPPPVEVKKIADIVRYEAKQQIPFDLDDVVWDYQTMPGSLIEEGYALESEVGLFAMKRQQVFTQLEPFDQANIEVDVIQLAPVALYNMVAYDRMHERVEQETFDPENPPPCSVLLSIGTDSSDLIVTNGFRIWQRSMPIGGNHFTRQLTKDLKLTFAKAEHLKRNAREAVDPKLVFQTMRPVFNDLVTEVQRSIGYFRSLDKRAEIGELLVTGSTVKMPGLAAYLGKNLGFDVHVLDRFNRLSGDDTLSIPAFRDNAPTFAVCYGLCVQGLGQSQIHANLVPREILTQRLIRSKKPWTVAALAVLLLGMVLHYWMIERSWASTHDDVWEEPVREIDRMVQYRDGHVETDEDLAAQLTYLNTLGEEVSGNAERRLRWLEVFKVINDVVPRPDADKFAEGKIPSHREFPYDERKDIHVRSIDTKYYDDLTQWWAGVSGRYQHEINNWRVVMKDDPLLNPPPPATEGEDAAPAAVPTTEELLTELFGDLTGPSGSGWVLQLDCYHYFTNKSKYPRQSQEQHIRKYMTTDFLTAKVRLPVANDRDGKVTFEEFTLAEIGLKYPLLISDGTISTERIENPDYDPSRAEEEVGNAQAQPPDFEVRRHDFRFQIVWQNVPLSQRIEAKEAAREKAAQEQAAAEGNVAASLP